MINTIFKVVEYGTPDYVSSFNLRENVLHKPLEFVCQPEDFEKEKNYIHIAGFYQNTIISTSVLVLEEKNHYKLRGVAVEKNFQFCGIGSQMLKFCEEYLFKKNIKSIYCHAVKNAVNFYAKNGYIKEGDFFKESSNSLVIKMRKNIS